MEQHWLYFAKLVFYFLVTVLGVISHFLKKKIKGETLSDITEYFKDHFKSTIVTIIAAVISFAVLVASNDISILSAFAVGYSADSLFNKAKR